MTTTRCLPAELTIYTVGETHPVCLAWLEGDFEDPLQVDASRVNEVDAAGAQLLLALARGLDRQERRLQLLQPSAALAAACDALGLASLTSATAAPGATA